MVSISTSIGEAVLEGTNNWCHSSSPATAAEMATAASAQRMSHLRPLSARKARRSSAPRMPYSVRCAAFRIAEWRTSNRSGAMGPPAMALINVASQSAVWAEENDALEAAKISAVHTIGGTQKRHTVLVDIAARV